jgi:pimeloyl-ACP methyl ester carboxylesterase
MNIIKLFFKVILILFVLTCVLLVLTRVIPIGSQGRELLTLSEMKGAFPEMRLATEEGEIAYHQSGEGKTLVLFIHGSPGLWNAFGGYMKDENLTENDITMVAYDRPGYGETNVRGTSSLEAQADIAEVIIGKYNLPTIIVAHSYGGAIATAIAEKYPQGIKSIVLIAPTLDPEGEESLWFLRMTQWITRTPIGRALASEVMVLAADEVWRMPEEMRALALLTKDIKIPITIVHGDKDYLAPISNLDYARELFSGAEVAEVVVEGGSHFLPWTEQGLITETISKNL